MLISKSEVSNMLGNILSELTSVKQKKGQSSAKDFAMQLMEEYNFKPDYAMDLLLCKHNFEDETPFVLYCLTKTVAPDFLTDWFSDTEINSFDGAKVKETILKFPLKLDVQKVDEDQFSFATDMKWIMKLRDGQYIHYNENNQRPMTATIMGNTEYFVPTVERKQVENIKNSMLNSAYIPTPIFLNIPEESDFEYNESTGKLIINSIKAFDIIDGYHRYLAMSEIATIDNKFNYPSWIIFTTFSDKKAKQFIWQSDQKVKMKKVESDSYNQNNYGNQVVQMVSAEYPGLINNNNYIINFAKMSMIINIMWFNDKGRHSRSEIVKIKNQINKSIESILEVKENLLDKKLSLAELLTLVYCSKHKKEKEYNEILGVVKEDIKTLCPNATFNATNYRRLIKLVGKEV